jgi:hypothetical protein
MRRNVRTVTVEQIRDEAFMKGLSDGQRGHAYDPSYKWGRDDRDSYKAGFDLAREQPRI